MVHVKIIPIEQRRQIIFGMEDPRYYEMIKLPHAQNYFQVGRGVNISHVQAVFGKRTMGLPQDVLEALVRKVKHDKADAKQWGMQKIQEQVLIGYNKSISTGTNIYSWKELVSKWGKDEKGYMVKRM